MDRVLIYKINLTVLIFCTFTLIACEGGRWPHKNSFGQIHPEDAAADACGSLKNGDTRLRAVKGYALDIPGASIAVDDAKRKYGILVIPNTGDSYINSDERSYNKNARMYASAYSKIVVCEVKCK